jgi:hypothetical protein
VNDSLHVPRFLVVFASYTQPGEWITAPRLARRIMPMRSSAFAKEVSRKLSNLNRFGHLEREWDNECRVHKYARPQGRLIVLPDEFKSKFRFTLPDPMLDD